MQPQEPPPVGAQVGAQQERAVLVQVGGCLGCGLLILVVFGLLAVTVLRSDRRFTTDPAEVEETLRAVLPAAEVPEGYRAFRAADVPGERLAQLVPEGYQGELVPLDEALTIAVWSLPAGTDLAAAREQVDAYWPKLVAERLGEGAGEATSDAPLELRLGDAPLPARDRLLRGKERPVRLITAAAVVGEAPVAFAFVGDAERFDLAAVRRFLEAAR